MVVEQQLLGVEDEEDLEYLLEEAKQKQLDLRINFRSDAKQRRLKLSPRKGDENDFDETLSERLDGKEEEAEISTGIQELKLDVPAEDGNDESHELGSNASRLDDMNNDNIGANGARRQLNLNAQLQAPRGRSISFMPSNESIRSSTDGIMYKNALNIDKDVIFTGNDSKLNVFAFKRKIMYHSTVYELLPKDLYKLLMNGTIIKNDAFDVLQINIMKINPNFYTGSGSLEDNDYNVMIQRIWDLLELNYGQSDRVIEYTNRIKNFKQRNLTTLEYIAKFQTFLNELRLELAIRNENNVVHVELTTYEYARIIMANARPEVMEFVAKQAIDYNEDAATLSLESVLRFLRKYSKIERIKRNAIITLNTENKRGIYAIDENKNDAMTEEIELEFSVNAIKTNVRYCYNGTKQRCRKNDCKFAHFPDDTKINVIYKYFEKFRNKSCNNKDNCKIRNCPYGHSAKRRKSLGVCRFDGRCTRKNCIYYHHKQDNGNMEIDKNVHDAQRKKENNDKSVNEYSFYALNAISDETKLISSRNQNLPEEFRNDTKLISSRKEKNKLVSQRNQNESTQKLYKISKQYENHEMVQYVFDDKDAVKADIEHEIITNGNLQNLQKITKGYNIHDYNYRLQGFIDSGSDCSAAGDELFDKFPEFVVKNKLKSVTLVPAGGEGKYKTNKRSRICIDYKDFDLNKEKWTIKKVMVELWHFPGLPSNMILLGRDAMRRLGLGIYDKAVIKYALYTKFRSIGYDNMFNDEETNALFDRLEYRGGDEPGLYVVDETKNTAVAIQADVKDLKIKQEQQNEEIQLKEKERKLYFITRTAEDEIKYQSHDLMKIDFNKFEPQVLRTNHDELNDNELIKIIRNNNRLIKDPTEILNQITFGKEISAERLTLLKQQLVTSGLIEVFTAYDWDLSLINTAEFKLKIKDETKCKILDPYQVNDVDLQIVNKEIEYWIKSKSMHVLKQNEVMKHASPVFPVHRNLGTAPDGKQIIKSRLAVDFTELNNNTHRYVNEYDVTIEEIQESLSQYKYYNSTDISKYFYCIPVEASSKQYGGISWYNLDRRKMYGIMDVVMHGLTDAPIYGQEITAKAFKDTDCCTVQDDIFGGGTELEQTIIRFIEMLEISRSCRFRLNARKTNCAVIKIDAVGYIISSKGICPLPRNCTKALCLDVSLINDYKCVRKWCGALNFLNAYLPKIAIKTKRLKELIFNENDMNEINEMKVKPELKRKLRDGIKTKFNDEAIEIVKEINNSIKNIPLLHHVDRRKGAGSLLVKVDTSLYGTGASLWQNRANILVLCRLYSKALTATESNYASTEREALGVIKTVERWSKLLINRHFYIMTDHKSLLLLFGINAQKTKNYKLVRFRWRLAEYLFTMIYIKGNSLEIAIEDFLSRYSKQAINSKNLRENGIKINLNDVQDNEMNVNAINGYDIELFEAIGFETDADFEIMVKQNFSINLIEQQLKMKKQTILYQQNESDVYVGADQNVSFDDKSMLNFKISCDINNYNKKLRLYNPLEYHSNISDAILKNNDDFINCAETLRDVLLIRGVIQNVNGSDESNEIFVEFDGFDFKTIDYKNVNYVQTRAMKKKADDIIYKQLLEKFQFKTSKSYLFEMTDGDIFKNDQNPLKTIYDLQRREYPNIIYWLIHSHEHGEKNIHETKTNSSRKEKCHDEKMVSQRNQNVHEPKMNSSRKENCYDAKMISPRIENYTCSSRDNDLVMNFNEMEYYDLLKRGEITVNSEGILCYDDKYIIPSKLRVPLLLYYHTVTVKQHRGEKVMIDAFKDRFYWKGMISDIKEFVKQCICRTAKLNHKKDAAFKDKGVISVYYATRQNEILYLDLYGALPDGNYAASIIDGFDGFLVSTALRPIYDLSAFGIIKFIMFEWIWIYGIPDKIVTDNGSNLVCKLNKLFGFIFGIENARIFAYSAWVNGKIEVSMKGITQAVIIENTRREILGLTKFRDMIQEAINSKEYYLLIKTAALINNNTKKESTGFEPRKLRFIDGNNIMLDIQLKLSISKDIKRDQYLNDGIVDYKKFYKLLRIHNKFIIKKAKLKKLKELNDKNVKNDAKGIESEQIAINDYVIYKSPYKSKKENCMKYGWIVIDIKRKGDKQYYVMKNIFNNEIIESNKGHIMRFHKPVVKPLSMMQNELSRIIDYEKEH